MSTRADGFYWVRYEDRPPEVAEWSDGAWSRFGFDGEYFGEALQLFEVLSARLVPPGSEP